MALKKVEDISNFWKWWSVRLGLLAASLSAAAAAYGAAYAISPNLVAGVPQWLLTVLTVGAMVTGFASVWARGLDQPKLRKDC